MMKTITCRFERIAKETDKAIQLEVLEKLVWLPKSQVTVNREAETFTAPVWLLEKKEAELNAGAIFADCTHKTTIKW